MRSFTTQSHVVWDCKYHVVIVPKYRKKKLYIGFLKGKSAIRMHYEFGNRKAPTQQKNFWSRGYFVSTVGIDEETIRNYVKNQDAQDKYEDNNPALDLYWN